VVEVGWWFGCLVLHLFVFVQSLKCTATEKQNESYFLTISPISHAFLFLNFLDIWKIMKKRRVLRTHSGDNSDSSSSKEHRFPPQEWLRVSLVRKRERDREREREAITFIFQKCSFVRFVLFRFLVSCFSILFLICSTSLPGGNQVDGLPPA